MLIKTGAVLGEGFWSVVMPVAVVLPECAMVSQGMTMNVREVNKIRLQRDCRRIVRPRIYYDVLDLQHVFTYRAPSTN